jgi:hypothetical protein
MSLGETLLRPTAMLYRNLASMDVEESIRGNPIDGVVLLMGCDKTPPSLVMGASSIDLPTIGVSGGPMLSGWYRGERIGSGTNTWSLSEDLRAGKITQDEFHEAESCMHPLPRALHDDGHGLDHGLDGGSAGAGASRQCRVSRRGRAPQRDRAERRPAHRRDGQGGPVPLEDPHARRFRERRSA